MNDELKRLSGLPGKQLAREIQSLRRKNREIQRLCEEWSALVAHDMLQPLATIQLSDELLGTLEQGEEGMKALQRISLSTQRLVRMVQDLIDVSLVETDRLQIHRERIHLHPMLCRVVEELAPILADRNVRLEVPADLPPVEADSQRLVQVFGNLLANAAKYGLPKTPIVVTASANGSGSLIDAVEVSIVNQGATTLSAEEIGRVFSRFYRAPSQEGTNVRGLGVGLYIAKGIVESHGGTLSATSKEGVTAFRVTLPWTR